MICYRIKGYFRYTRRNTDSYTGFIFCSFPVHVLYHTDEQKRLNRIFAQFNHHPFRLNLICASADFCFVLIYQETNSSMSVVLQVSWARHVLKIWLTNTFCNIFAAFDWLKQVVPYNQWSKVERWKNKETKIIRLILRNSHTTLQYFTIIRLYVFSWFPSVIII